MNVEVKHKLSIAKAYLTANTDIEEYHRIIRIAHVVMAVRRWQLLRTHDGQFLILFANVNITFYIALHAASCSCHPTSNES